MVYFGITKDAMLVTLRGALKGMWQHNNIRAKFRNVIAFLH